MGIEMGKGQPVALPGEFLKILHRILQAAGGMDHGDGPVLHGNHLAQAAGFVPGGHQEEIRPGIDPVGQILAEQNVHGHLVRIPGRQGRQGLFIGLVPGAHDYQLHILLEHFIHDAGEEIQSLGLHQPGNHGKHRDPPVHRQPQFLLEGFLVQGFPDEHILVRIPIRDPGILRRIIGLFVHTVEDAGDFPPAEPHIPVQPFPEIGILDFLRIGGAYGVHRIRVFHPRLQVVHAAVVLDPSAVKQAPGEPQHILHHFRGEDALVFHVVDGEQALHPLVEGILLEILLQVDPHQPGVPVVAVDHIRPEPDMGQHGQQGPAEIGEPFPVVIEPVQAVPFEIVFVVDEEHRDPVQDDFLHPHVLPAPGQVHRAFPDRFHLAAEPFCHPAVLGDHQGRFHPFPTQFGRQGPHYIGQSPGFDEGHSLRRCQ